MTGKIAGAAVADRDRRVGTVAGLHHERRHRLADNGAPAHDNNVRASRFDSIVHEHALYARRCTGREPVRMSDEQLADIHRMEPVHVLQRIDVPDHRVGIDVLWQRHLHENTVHRAVRVELLHEREQLRLRGARGQPNGLAGHARFTRRLLLRANIDRAPRVVANEHHGEPGCHAGFLEREDVRGDVRADELRQRDAVDQLRAGARGRN